MSRGITLKPKSDRVRVKLSLPGDTPGLVAALHVLSRAGLLAPNTVSQYQLPCPRCGRMTCVSKRQYYDNFPPWGVCAQCRVDWVCDHPDWSWSLPDLAAANAEFAESWAKFFTRLRAAKRKAGQS